MPLVSLCSLHLLAEAVVGLEVLPESIRILVGQPLLCKDGVLYGTLEYEDQPPVWLRDELKREEKREIVEEGDLAVCTVRWSEEGEGR